jgi:hypothetical protein
MNVIEENKNENEITKETKIVNGKIKMKDNRSCSVKSLISQKCNDSYNKNRF